jgi:hypothetical protein
MTIDLAGTRAWAEANKAAWEIAPLVVLEQGQPVTIGFELQLFARVPVGLPPSAERERAVIAVWDRLNEIAGSLGPLLGADGRIEVEPWDAASRLRPETEYAPEVLLVARLYHAKNTLSPATAADRERVRPLEQHLTELGLRQRSW